MLLPHQTRLQVLKNLRLTTAPKQSNVRYYHSCEGVINEVLYKKCLTHADMFVVGRAIQLNIQLKRLHNNYCVFRLLYRHHERFSQCFLSPFALPQCTSSASDILVIVALLCESSARPTQCVPRKSVLFQQFLFQQVISQALFQRRYFVTWKLTQNICAFLVGV